MSRSIDQILDNSRLAIFGAMNHPEICKQLEPLGYDLKKMREGESLLKDVWHLKTLQNQQYGDKRGVYNAMKAERSMAFKAYTRHVTFARLAFKNNKAVWEKLKLTGSRKRSLAGWLEQARTFYEEIVPVSAEMQRVGISPEELQQTWAMIEAVEETRRQHKKNKGNAQQATKERNKAIRKLETWMSRFIKTARIALDEQEQLLEAMGIKVKV